MNQTARFRFGQNWQDFAARIDDRRVAEAECSLTGLLGVRDLAGKSFLDIGSGSGLFSLAAHRLGATVHSFDFDADSVACTAAVRDRLASGGAGWQVERGSVLDGSFMAGLGQFDVVYSWGVLHHTGAMWAALKNAAGAVAPRGTLAIALYRKTPLCGLWAAEKSLYARAPRPAQAILRVAYKAALLGRVAASGKNPAAYIKHYRSGRGMTWHNDVHDWLGGYPYESATAPEVVARLRDLGFVVTRSNVTSPGIGLFGTGCDEFVAELAAR